MLWVSIHSGSKMKKLGKVNKAILILQLDRSRSKNKAKPRYETKKLILKQELGSRLDWKIVEIFQDRYKLNND